MNLRVRRLVGSAALVVLVLAGCGDDEPVTGGPSAAGTEASESRTDSASSDSGSAASAGTPTREGWPCPTLEAASAAAGVDFVESRGEQLADGCVYAMAFQPNGLAEGPLLNVGLNTLTIDEFGADEDLTTIEASSAAGEALLRDGSDAIGANINMLVPTVSHDAPTIYVNFVETGTVRDVDSLAQTAEALVDLVAPLL